MMRAAQVLKIRWRKLLCRGRPGLWLGLLAAGLALYGWWAMLPQPLFDAPYSGVLHDRRGTLLSARIAADGQWRFPPPDSVPHRFATALQAFEDQHFYRHPGVDPLAVARAAYQNLRAGRTVSGASTLTMQLIRTALQRPPRTLWQKARESLMALRLELTHSKSEILRQYAGHAPFGGNVVGLPAATWRYYGKPAHQLSWAEAATLAVLPNAPSLVHPGRGRRALRRKRDFLLRRLLRQGEIDSTQFRLALMEPLPQKPKDLPQAAPHLLAHHVKQGRAGAAQTTLDARLQRSLNELLNRKHYRRLSANGIHNIAAVVAEVDRGEVRAYVGNTDRYQHPALGCRVDVVQAERSPGSTLKPLLYASMLDAGELLPRMLVPDIPISLGGYRPQNYDREFSGAVPANEALARSLNVPAVHMLHRYSVAAWLGRLRRAGLTTLDQSASHYGLSLILGGGEVTLWQMTGLYASMARSLKSFNRRGGYAAGDYHPLRYRKTEGPSDTAPSVSAQPRHFSAGALWLTFEAMQEVDRPGASAYWRRFASARQVAWKTGTSFGGRDAWALAVTPDFVVGIWAGNSDGSGRPGLSGYRTAAPILFDVLERLPYGGAWFARPESGLRQLGTCSKSGFVAGPHCPELRPEAVPRHAPAQAVCPYHRHVHLDKEGRRRVHSRCYPVSMVQTTSWFVLPPRMAAYYARRQPGYRPLPPYRTGCADASGEDAPPLALIYPTEHTTLHLPRLLDGQRGSAVFLAAHARPGSTVHWHLDGRYLGRTRRDHRMTLAPSAGVHRLRLVDEAGHCIERRFSVAEHRSSGP